MKKILQRFSLSSRIGMIITTYSIGVLIVAGIAIYGFEVVRTEFVRNNDLLGQNTVRLVELQAGIDETAQTYQLIVAEKGTNGLAQLKLLREVKERFLSDLNKLSENNPTTDWMPQTVEEIKNNFAQLETSGKEMTLGFLREDHGLVDKSQKELEASIDGIRAQISEISLKFNTHTKEVMFGVINATNTWMAIFGVVGLVLSLGLALVISSLTRKELEVVSNRLKEAAANNVSSTLNIKSVLSSVTEQAHHQAESTQKTASALHQISAMTQMSANNAEDSSNKAKFSQECATEGKSAVDEVVASMNNIQASNQQVMDALDENQKNMLSILDVIREIEQKTKVINDIVFQTRLLSFNASVEAARAGEHGKGFAVVAEEVGNLAQVSGKASNEISQMLTESTSRVQSLVEGTKKKVSSLVEQGKVKIETGLNTASQSGQVLQQIVENVKEVSVLMNSISQSSQEQAAGVKDISSALENIDESVNTSLKSIGLASNDIEKVLQEANYLNEMTQSLESLIYGNKKVRAHSSPKESIEEESFEVAEEDHEKLAA